MYQYERIQRYILNEVETSHHLILIRLYFILTILITEDDLFRQCDLYFFIFIIGYEKKPAEMQMLKKNMVVIVFRN
jgi:hypothetical protein